jgi:hypothetical protein
MKLNPDPYPRNTITIERNYFVIRKQAGPWVSIEEGKPVFYPRGHWFIHISTDKIAWQKEGDK